MISLERYAALLRSYELRSTFLASLVGRIPIGLTGLAILLLVQSHTGSFAHGGAATGCYVTGLAIVAPALGRVIDRHGPRLILLSCGLVFPAVLVALVWAVSAAAPAWSMLALSGLAGLAFPPITVCMRTFLKQRLADDASLAAAYSLESVLIELVFIIGPMLVALFVAVATPAAAVLSSALFGLTGTLMFLRSPGLKHWRIETKGRGSLLGPLSERRFVVLLAVILCYSMAFGLLEIGITAHATEAGNQALAGVLLGLMSVGSALGGLVYGSRSWHYPLTRQFAFMLLMMAVGLYVLALEWRLPAFAALSALAGVVMAPALIMQSMLVAKTARPEHSTEAFTWSSSALLGGVGLGFAAGGGLLEYFQSPAAFAASASAALAAAGLARLVLARASDS